MTDEQEKEYDALIFELCNKIKTTNVDYVREKFPDLIEFTTQLTNKREMTQEIVEQMTKCLEIQLRALAFELGYARSMLYIYPREQIERIIAQEMNFGSSQYWIDSEAKMAALKKAQESVELSPIEKTNKDKLN